MFPIKLNAFVILKVLPTNTGGGDLVGSVIQSAHPALNRGIMLGLYSSVFNAVIEFVHLYIDLDL